MIASISGRVSQASLDQAVVVVGGVGLKVTLTPDTAASLRPGENTDLFTSMVIRDDAWTLYGFAEETEREVFELAQRVSGIGPRIALAMLSVLPPQRLSAAIASGDTATLIKVPGIGRKSADRIVLELKDTMAAYAAANPADPDTAAVPVETDASAPWRTPVVEALTSLGWSSKQAEAGADAVLDEVGADAPVGTALKAALRELGR